VFNARDAMPDGGIIAVRVENLADSGRRERPGELPAGDFVRISVVDTGTGMPPDVQARAIEPFFTTKEVGKGSGLGLAQAYGFARGSGGLLHIESEVGRGTRVMLTLPRSHGTPVLRDEGSGGPTPLDASEGRQRHILLVEDDDEVASLLDEMLEQLGYEVLRTASASAALGALANSRPIDLVFSDIMMPGDMDGLGLARELRHRRPDLPVLLTSGYADAFGQQPEVEGFQVLRKPYRLEELSSALSKAFQKTRH
jgi:CheY-like chemotaxis protein